MLSMMRNSLRYCGAYWKRDHSILPGHLQQERRQTHQRSESNLVSLEVQLMLIQAPWVTMLHLFLGSRCAPSLHSSGLDIDYNTAPHLYHRHEPWQHRLATLAPPPCPSQSRRGFQESSQKRAKTQANTRDAVCLGLRTSDQTRESTA